MSDKVTKEEIENQSFVNKLQNDMINLLGEERSVIEDIKSIERQLVKSKQDSLDATDQTVSLAKAQRDLADELAGAEKARKKNLQEAKNLEAKIAAAAKNKLGLSKKDLQTQIGLLHIQKDTQKHEQALLDKDIAGLKNYEEKISKAQALNKVIQSVGDSFGAASSGAIAIGDNLNSALSAIPGGAALAKVLGIDDLSNRLQDVAKAGAGSYLDAIEAGKSPMQAASAAAKTMGAAFNTMLGPVLLIGAAIAGIGLLFMSISKEASKTATEMGVTFAQAKKLNDAARQVQSTFGTQLATMEDITAVQKEQIQLLGSAALVNTKVAAGVADMGKAFGYGAEQAGKTHAALMLIGASQEQASQIQLNTNKKALEAGVSVAAVQKDIADNAAGALKYLGGSADAIADAAVKAAKLGVSLGTMVKVSDALLDIEGSLTSQFEFQALTGKDINLDLARQKALQGDIAGATEEALKAVKSSAEFDEMGVFAKQALAKATGVSVEELQKSLLIQEKLGNLTDDQKAAAANLGLSAAEMKNMSAEELKNKLAQQQSMDKAGAAFDSMKNQLSTALLPLAEAFGAVFTLLGPVLKTVGFLIKTLLSPIQLISNLLSGSTSEMSTFQKIAGGVLSVMLAIKGATMANNAMIAIRNAYEATYGTMTKRQVASQILSNTYSAAGNALKSIRNFLMSTGNATEATGNALSTTGNTLAGTQLSLFGSQNVAAGTQLSLFGTKNALATTGNVISGTANTLDATSNALAIAGNVQEGITTGAKGTQLGLQTGMAAAQAATAAATAGAAVGQTALAAATGVAAGAQAGLAAAALTTNAAMTFGVGTVIAIAAAAAAIGGLIGYMSKSSAQGKDVGDLSSPAKGTTQVSTAEGGLFNTSPNDDVAAGPGILSRLKGAASDPLGALGSLFSGGESDSGGGINNEAILAKLDQVIMACKTPPPVYIGNKAVTELASALQINESFQTTQNVSGETN